MSVDVTFILFGATGHLGRTKLLPALAKIVSAEGLSSHAVIGVGSRARTTEEFTTLVASSLEQADVSAEDTDRFLGGTFAYQAVSDDASFTALVSEVARIEAEQGLSGNRVAYLAVPPSKLDATVAGISKCRIHDGNGWTRLVVEKPFGIDLETARTSNAIIHRTFPEEQVYRIDHFLGKETVRNLLVFRFSNSLFEQTWNRRHIESVEITVAEDAGLSGRAAYYDESGAVRDMLQNHLTQIMTLIAMEPPVKMDAASIHAEKVKVLDAVRSLDLNEAVLARYVGEAGDSSATTSYLDEPGVREDSTTPTFVAVALHIDNWRWQGVPFYLRTGKRMSARVSEVTVRYLRPPVCLFHRDSQCPGHQNVLKLRLQPDEGFSLLFDVKQPGPNTTIGQIPLTVAYHDLLENAPDAYETLLGEIIEGDQTLFVRSDEVEKSWEIYQPLLDDADVDTYAAGTDGPESAERLIVTHPGVWSDVSG
jgi:glucose-6-phosphate 1-dehydrogenase